MDHQPPARGWPTILLASAFGYTIGTIHTRHALRRQLAAACTLAHRDPLTGLPNRRALITEVQARLAAGTPTVLALLDLDDFKTVNDTYGHPTGDDLLTAVAARLHTAAGPEGYAARLAGDEFVILLPYSDTDLTEAITALLTMLSEPVHLPTATLRPHASVGVITSSRTLTTWRQLITAADRALYRAKTTGTHMAIDHHSDTTDTTETPLRTNRRRRSRRP